MNAEGEADYKTSQRFAEHMRDSEGASSDFAKKKTIQQQRQYLPVFAVRQQVAKMFILLFKKCLIYFKYKTKYFFINILTFF